MLLYKHPYKLQENSFNTINASIREEGGWEVLKANESRRAASRVDIMMTLLNVDKILIRYLELFQFILSLLLDNCFCYYV